MTGDNWVQSVLDFDLLDKTPPEVQKLFEVARGSMAYGYFFYPLLTLATEQLYRVAEAAVDHKCREIGRHKPKATFADKIKWLIEGSVIADESNWDAIRNLRNEASHPRSQTILSPGMVLGLLETVTECINSLFGGPEHPPVSA
ncbi:MAG: hypothetical protein ACT4QB_17040 [Gammaproteobacteria bacterium]